MYSLTGFCEINASDYILCDCIRITLHVITLYVGCFFRCIQIRRDGEILSEASLYADSLKKDQKRQAKEAILRSLESRKEDLTRNHQSLCLRTIEEIEKIERVEKIRVRLCFHDSILSLSWLIASYSYAHK